MVDVGAATYDAAYYESSYLAVPDERTAFMRSLLAPLESLGGTVLDVGAGPGFALDALERSDRVLLGLDASEPAAKITATRGHLAVRAEASALPIRSGSASAVLLVDVLAHVPAPIAALREVSRALRPGGIVLIKTPNRPARVYELAARLPRRVAASLVHAPRQLRAVTPRGLELALDDLSLDVTTVARSREALGMLNRWRAGARGSLITEALASALAGRPSWVVWARKR